ncbi:inosine-uridine preferring nucleoside hydrolase-like [Leptopilina boulardi]|uniref:inosine-uridine preferring nucleoside hydrolase-like n=1 Tax=Leptopilina boulardi TaxID=63433 RepID=UPI0021F63375|nr:inosine-uridine preferring nucleoside hydrolase-like [Leptopilina boulardi]XP_051173344.1 inosine-uridine preferring nucleoside hydrolase-like [Leptopilina boulardi]XP_051173345.1 inosine-uridine preferring nucleoside hydrolase-like [Leptopilina boulardi]
MKPEKIIVDCDAGTDDALSLILLIEAHKLNKIELLGITCVNGNTSVDNVVSNVFRTLEVCNGNDIPVYKGAYSSLLNMENKNKTDENIKYHGSDGFGDVFQNEPDINKLKSEHAVCALEKIVSQFPDEVSILALGPLTNIALAIKMYPNFANNVKRFYVMGGNYTALGNTTPQAEFNFFSDPESAHILLCSTNKLWLFPWETCLKSQVTNEWRKEVFGQIDTPVVHLMNAIEAEILSSPEKMLPFYTPCDVFLAAVVLNPKMVTNLVPYHIDIELNGNKTRGMVVIDHFMTNESNAHIIKDFDSEIFKNFLLFAANPLEYKNRIFQNCT